MFFDALDCKPDGPGLARPGKVWPIPVVEEAGLIRLIEPLGTCVGVRGRA